MSKVVKTFAGLKPRLLAMSSFIAAGAVASAAAAQDPAVGAVVAILQTLAGLAGNIAATDVHATLSNRVLRADVLNNHDLARAVRDAISAVISKAAKEVADGDERAALEKIDVTENIWREAETIWQPQTVEGLTPPQVVEMFSKTPDEFARFKALDLDAWQKIVGGLAAANELALEGDVISAPGGLKLSKPTVDLVASRLHETFPRALYEILKEDFAHDGKAYGGLLIRLVGNISAKQVETLSAAREILSRTGEILETVRRTEVKVDGIGEDTKKILERLSSSQSVAAPIPKRLTLNLPPDNKIFTGRREVLDALKAELEKSGRAALSGMPGVGKTQTAIEYAHEQHAAQVYDYVIYARAASETELLADFQSAARELNLPGKDNADINLVAAAVKAWLEGAEKWLLIFDNADNLRVVRDHEHNHIPANAKGHVLFTRRPDDAGGVAHTIKIKEMNEDEGALLLLRRAELVRETDTLAAAAPDSAEQARAIARETGGLPLSLGIAGAVIRETRTPLDEYLKDYIAEGRLLRQERDPNALYEHSVAAAFGLAFRQLSAPDDDKEESAVIARAAADLLRLCAFFAPDAIPLELILAGDASTLGEDLQRALSHKIWRKKTIARATRFSLLDANPQAQTYDMHREVQAVMRDEMDDETQRLWAERALQTLVTTFPDPADFNNWKRCDLFLPHMQVCLKHGDRLNIGTEVVALLKNQTGFHLNSRIRYAEAEPLYKQALEIWRKLFGLEHPDVAQSMNNLAELYRTQGRYDEAEPLYEQALELNKKLFSLEHPSVATSMNNLAELYRAQGRYAEAEPLYEQALAMFEKMLGENHPNTITVRKNFEMFQTEKALRESQQRNVKADKENDRI